MRNLLFLILCSCSFIHAVERVTLTPESAADLEAKKQVERFEAKLEEIQALPISERMEKSRKLESELKHLVKKVDGTRFENKARYYLADWRLQFAPTEDIQSLIESNLRSEHLHYKNLTQLLQARYLIAEGRIADARTIAESVVDRIPEFEPILADITFHECAGQPSPEAPTVVRNLMGGPQNPISDRPEAWLVVYFISLSDPDQLWWLQEQLAELSDPAYQGKVRPCLIAFDSDPLVAMSKVRSLPGGDSIDMLWVNKTDERIVGAWQEAWSLPALPASCVLGPGRTRLSHGPSINRLRSLVGLKEKTYTSAGGNRTSRGGPKKFGIRGRK